MSEIIETKNNDIKMYGFDIGTEINYKTGSEFNDARVTNIAIYGENKKENITNSSEEVILQKFQQEFVLPNIRLIGFNSAAFDVPHLIKRAKKYNLDLSILESLNFDIKYFLPKKKVKRYTNTLQSYGEAINYSFCDNGYGKSHYYLLWEYTENMEILNERLWDDAKLTWKLATEGLPTYAMKKYQIPKFPIENQGIIRYISNNNEVSI